MRRLPLLATLALAPQAQALDRVRSAEVSKARNAGTRVTHVFVGGAPQSLETRHTRRYERYKERP